MMCELVPIVGNNRAFTWACNDFSDVPTGHQERFSAKFQTDELAINFREAFEAAREFNSKLKQGLMDELVFAPTYEEAAAAVESPESPADNPEINKESEEQDHVDVFGGDDE